MPNNKYKEVPNKSIFKLAIKIASKLPMSIHDIPPNDKRIGGGGMRCVCEGMHPNPECPLHRRIG
jgi:hypothetical protein